MVVFESGQGSASSLSCLRVHIVVSESAWSATPLFPLRIEDEVQYRDEPDNPIIHSPRRLDEDVSYAGSILPCPCLTLGVSQVHLVGQGPLVRGSAFWPLYGKLSLESSLL